MKSYLSEKYNSVSMINSLLALRADYWLQYKLLQTLKFVLYNYKLYGSGQQMADQSFTISF
jgi:hypothetical protein